jgi:hypothetical protein
MTLTVPKAGVIAGRSANVPVAARNTGSAVAEFGSAAMQIGTAMERDRLDRQAQRLQLDVTRDLGQLRQEFEQLGDPDAIDTLWPQRVAELKQKYLTGADDNGLPRVDKRIADRFDMAVTGLADRHADALGYKAIGLRQSQRTATSMALQDEIVVQGATTDDETLQALIAQGEADIDARAAANGMDAAAVYTEKKALRTRLFSQRAASQIEADPEGFLAAAEAGAYNDLGEDVTKLRILAQRSIDERTAKEAKAVEVAAKEAEADLDKRLTTMTSILGAGRTPADMTLLDSPEAQARPGWAKAKAAYELQGEIPNIKQMTVAELDAAIAAEEARPIEEEWENERLVVLRSWREEAAKGWNTGAVEQARDAGMAVPELPAFDPAAPDAFVQGLTKRLAFNDYATKGGYTKSQAILDSEEKAQLRAILDPKAEPGPKVALAKAILAADPRKAEDVAKVLEADPVFARTLSLLASTGDAPLVTEILRGQQRQALGTVNLPSPANQRSILSQVTGGAFDGNPALQAEIMAAATALYADGAGASQTDVGDTAPAFMDDPAALDLFTSSIQRVTGAVPDANGQLTIGGVQPIGDAYVSLPAGVPAIEVEAGLENLQRHLDGQRWDPSIGGWDSSAMETPPDPMRAFAAAGLEGAKPDLGKTPRDLFPSLQLHRVSEKADVYEFRYTVAGRTYTVRRADDAKGRAYRFRLSDLIREAGK